MQDKQPEKEAPKVSQMQMAKAFFQSHALSEDQQNRVVALREAAEFYVECILGNTKPCADQTAAIRKLRELHMTLVQAVSLEEFGK